MIAALIAVAAGLLVLGASTAGWSAQAGSREVGGVEVADVVVVTGAELRPGLMVVGLVLLIAAVALALARGGPRRVAGGAVVLTGLTGTAIAVGGLVAATRLGTLQAGAWLGLSGCLLGAAAGALAVGRPRRRARLPDRFDIDTPASPADGEHADEWTLAADDYDGPPSDADEGVRRR